MSARAWDFGENTERPYTVPERRFGVSYVMWDDGSWQIASDLPLTDATWPRWPDPNPMPSLRLFRWLP